MYGIRNQVVLPLNLEIKISPDDPVFMLVEICDELDYTELYRVYLRRWRKINPATMFEVLVFAYMNGIYSSRDIERACCNDIRFMWILQDAPAPDHATIARFQNERLTTVMENLFYQLIETLSALGEIAFENLFVDGTKIEANANRYTFVWAKAVQKNLNKLYERIEQEIPEIAFKYGLNPNVELEQAIHFLSEIAGMRGISFVSGKGKSYSKTDTDATFMRMKEDHMRNGQLKPGYNVQIGVESEYMIGVGLFANPTDTTTLIPFLERVQNGCGRKCRNMIADAGYSSEENYTYLENKQINAYIKPSD